jgi:hypothetical protein
MNRIDTQWWIGRVLHQLVGNTKDRAKYVLAAVLFGLAQRETNKLDAPRRSECS